MDDVKDILIDLLSEFNYPIYLQGSIAKDEPYPNSFFTFWNSETQNAVYYDNKPLVCVWNVRLAFYSIDPDLTNTVLIAAIKILRAAGWYIDSRGYDISSDEPTHTGRAIDALYVQKYKQEQEE